MARSISLSSLLLVAASLVCLGSAQGARNGGTASHFDIAGLSAVNALGADRAGRPFDVSNATLNAYINPHTSGVTFRASWATVEPASGSFDFSKIDDVFARADAHGKWVDLILIPGFASPAWALQGVQTVMFAIPYGPGGGTGKPEPLPVPWDRTYLSRWFAFLRVVGQRYAARTSFRKIAAAGPTSVSAEMSLPNSADDVAQWKRAGYSSDGYVEAWKQTFDAYMSTFPHQYVSLALFPGLPIPDRREQNTTRDRVIALGMQHPAQFALEEDGLNASRTTETFGYRAVIDHIGRVATGFMMSTSALERSERMGAGGNPLLALRKSIELGMAPNASGRHVDYLEIYEPDVTAAEMQSALQYGASLFSRAPGGR